MNDQWRNRIYDLSRLIIIFAMVMTIITSMVRFTRYQHAAAYPMDPELFRAQEELILPGMDVDKVRALLQGVTETGETSGTVYFAMKPARKPAFAIPPVTVNYYINVKTDANRKVLSVFTSDG